MKKQQIAEKLLPLLKDKYPEITPPLNHKSGFQLLIATILSAQTTDVRVNMVTPTLFERYPDARSLAAADLDDVKQIIKTIGLYNTKAKNIIATARIITDEFAGELPDNMPDLLKLKGVARKTASVVLWQWFGKNEGFTVDTHVMRLSKWFGLSNGKNAVQVERDLMQLFPQEEWGNMSLRIILLGRELLTARNPKYQGTVWEELLVGLEKECGAALTSAPLI